MEWGYDLQKLQIIAREVSRYKRDGLLAYKINVKGSVSPDLFMLGHPEMSKPLFIMNKNKQGLYGSGKS